MHDTYLLNKISQTLKEISEEHKIKRIDQLAIVVNHNSHINEESLKEHLELHNKEVIADELQIEIERDDIEDQTAIIYNIQGEILGI